MGLDVTYFDNLTIVDGSEGFDKTGKVRDDCIQLFLNAGFPGRGDTLQHKHVYRMGASGHFRAGAYSRYSRWRDELAMMAGWPRSSYHQDGRDWGSYAASAWGATEGPFWELINFSDCEGIIGPATSAKLARDFEEYQTEADKRDAEFRKTYNDFRLAFQTAANGGAVRFC